MLRSRLALNHAPTRAVLRSTNLALHAYEWFKARDLPGEVGVVGGFDHLGHVLAARRWAADEDAARRKLVNDLRSPNSTLANEMLRILPMWS